MNNFLPVKSNHRAAPLRLAARLFSIMILVFLWPARGGAVDQTPQDLDVSKITDVTTLTYKQKSGSDTYAWHYKIGTDGNETEFSGTLTGSQEKTDCPVITIKSNKEATSPNYDDCAKLILNGVKLTAVANADLFVIGEKTNPLCIQATSESTLKCKATDTNFHYVINNSNGGILLLDGGDVGLNIVGEGGQSYGIYLNTTESIVKGILKGKITVIADSYYAVTLGNAATLSADQNAKITASAGEKAILGSNSNVQSPFLEWRFEAAPGNGKTLEIKNANGNSLDPAIQFTTDDKNKHFAVNVTKGVDYTLWLGDKKLMDENGTTVFTATDDKLFSFKKMQTYLAKNWPDYGQTANVGTDGIDVAVSGANYTVKTACGLAWIAWVTNEGKTKSGNTGETYTSYYPASAGFKDCTVTLADNISLTTPEQGVASDFKNNWIPIGTYTSENDYTKCFQGTFNGDGDGKTITGMTISSTSVNYTGLFGYLYGATVENLTMVDGGDSNKINLTTVTGRVNTYPLGSIAGYVMNGKIINCHNKCAISFSNSDSGKGGYVGGIAGQINGSVISACSNSGAITVSGSTATGSGIVALSYASSIVSCFNTGNISATAGNSAYAVGIVGHSDINGSSPSHISDCYSTGNMTANSSQSASTSGGIVGEAQYVTIESCFATGSISAESSSSKNGAYAGGIIGWIWSGGSVTVKDCLALNTGGMKATGSTSDKQAGRIVGKDNNATLLNNYASTKIKLKKGDNDEFIPAENITADAVNGADIYLDEVATAIDGWAGSEDTKAFSSIDTDGNLPKLKVVIGYGADGLPTQYRNNDFLPGQPDNLTSSIYLASLEPLSLPSGNTDAISLSYSEGKWSYQEGENGTPTRFNGTVKMADGAVASTNKLIIATATGNPTLTFEKVDIKPTDGAALSIESGCALTINTTGEGTSTLISTNASTLVNEGSFALTGKGLHIVNVSATDTYYGLDNSGTFTVTDPLSTSVTFHCANTAIRNTGTFGNAWMEWRFATAPEQSDGRIAFAATDDGNQPPAALLRQGKTFATTVTADKTYQLWKVTDNGSEVRTRQQGKTSDVPAVPVVYFQAPADNDVTVFTNVKDAVPVTVTQLVEGGSISVFCNDNLVTASDVLPNGVILECKYSAIPGYQLNTYTATPSGESSSEASDDPKNTGHYQVPDDATSIVFAASFTKIPEATVTEKEVVEDVPTASVTEPTVVISQNERPTLTEASSTIKLVTGALEESHKAAVDEVINENVQNRDQLIYAEIALVEEKTDGTQIPIQPTPEHPVTVIYPYPAGTNADDTFTIVHVKMDGTTEVYSVAEDNLENAEAGLTFDVSSFSPFGIAWTKASSDPEPGTDPEPGIDPEPAPIFFTVTLPAVEGAITDPVAGNYLVEAGKNFRFFLTLKKDYDQSLPVVTTSRNETIEPFGNSGAYIIENVQSAVTITLSGIRKNTVVSNATLDSGLRIRTAPSALCIETDRASDIRIISVSGSTIASFKAQPGTTSRSLSPGIYIVKAENQAYKIIIK